MIERVHADGRQRACRRLFGRGTPIVRRNELSGARGVLRHHRDDGAEPPRLEMATQRNHRRMKAPAVADRQHHARPLRRGDSGIRARAVERDRLLDKDMLARGCGGRDLARVLGMRGGKHDRIHIRRAENLLITVDQHHVVVAAEFLRRRARARVGEDEADGVALAAVFALHRMNQRAPPATESHNGCADHLSTMRYLGGMIGSNR